MKNSKHRNFAGIEDRYAQFSDAAVFLQSIPYDGTSTWGKGANKAFEAFLDAAENMELYDIETNSEVYKQGIHILPEIGEDINPDAVFYAVYHKVKELIKEQRFFTFFGGEHSVSIGIIKAFYEKYPDLTVLQLDAHADLRPRYLGSPYNHACALHDASLKTNLIQVGIRSMDSSEKQYINPEKCFFAHRMQQSHSWIDTSLGLMHSPVYITIDLDVFDPSLMPATGTPEPGGMLWYEVLHYLKRVISEKEVIGFDIVELAPIKNYKAADFLVAKLYYKLLSYKFNKNEK